MITQMIVSKREFLKIKKETKTHLLCVQIYIYVPLWDFHQKPVLGVKKRKKAFFSTPDTNKSFIVFLYKGEVAF